MGGGTVIAFVAHVQGLGLSPRGRGNLSISYLYTSAQKSIPAWAGEPPDSWTPGGIGSVYPRVGGGTVRISGPLSGYYSLSPRGRGNLAKGISPDYNPGLSPRGRGNR